MKKIFVGISLILISFIFIGVFKATVREIPQEKKVSDSTDRVVFLPVEFNERATKKSEMYTVNKQIPEGFYQNLMFVLVYYHVPFREIDGAVYVSNDSWNDQDYIANLTAKALDKKWLLEHGMK